MSTQLKLSDHIWTTFFNIGIQKRLFVESYCNFIFREPIQYDRKFIIKIEKKSNRNLSFVRQNVVY